MKSRFRFPALPWEFFLKGRIPTVTMVWVGLRALLALHPPISPLTSSVQGNCASWASQPQKSVTLLPCPGGRTTKSTRTCGGIGQKKISNYASEVIMGLPSLSLQTTVFPLSYFLCYCCPRDSCYSRFILFQSQCCITVFSADSDGMKGNKVEDDVKSRMLYDSRTATSLVFQVETKWSDLLTKQD